MIIIIIFQNYFYDKWSIFRAARVTPWPLLMTGVKSWQWWPHTSLWLAERAEKGFSLADNKYIKQCHRGGASRKISRHSRQICTFHFELCRNVSPFWSWFRQKSSIIFLLRCTLNNWIQNPQGQGVSVFYVHDVLSVYCQNSLIYFKWYFNALM